MVLSLEENLRNKAKEMGLNLSGFLQSKLIEFIKNNGGQQLSEPVNNKISHWRVSIPRPADYKSAALPTELQWHHRANIWYKINLSMGIKQWAIL